MMDIKTFCEQYGQRRRPIEDVLGQWRVEQVDSFLDNLIAGGVLLSDLAIGDGLRDQISPELLEGFEKLMGGKADTYNEVREKLLALKDESVPGLVNKIKGQIGENIFVKEVGPHARLAASGSQEGWDVAIDREHGTQYVQVKMYKDADGVLRKMRDVQERVDMGVITDGEEAVNHIDFAVPSDIFDEVKNAALNDTTLRNIKVISIDMTAGQAANIVQEGVDNVGPEALEHFFGELLGDVLSAGSLHAVVNGFLLYKGAKEFEEAMADTAFATAISGAGFTAAMVTEFILEASRLGGPACILVGVGTRAFLSRVARSRWRFADFLECTIQHLEAQMRILRTVAT
ncbi:MAG: hypothetical protein ACYSTI_12895 [Planctomycetota bacterium]|jgi:hypothetical protein